MLKKENRFSDYVFASERLIETSHEITEGVDLGIWEEAEELIYQIATHFASCDDCRSQFDAQGFENFFAFEAILGQFPQIESWICGREAK